MREKKKFKVKDNDTVTDEVSVSDNDVKDEVTDEASVSDNDQPEGTNDDVSPSEIKDLDINALPEQKNGTAKSWQ